MFIFVNVRRNELYLLYASTSLIQTNFCSMKIDESKKEKRDSMSMETLENSFIKVPNWNFSSEMFVFSLLIDFYHFLLFLSHY